MTDQYLTQVHLDGKPVLTTRSRPRDVQPGTKVVLLDGRTEVAAVTVTSVQPHTSNDRTVGYNLYLDTPTLESVYYPARSWVEVLVEDEQTSAPAPEHTDLHAVSDHPATLLSERAEQMTRSINATLEERSATFDAAHFLERYEREHDVTFAALDNVTLEYVRQQWTEAVNGNVRADVTGAIKDLLGLEV